MRRIIVAAAVLFLICAADMPSRAAMVSMKPEKYARDPHGSYSMQISPKIKKKADKVHKAIRKSNKKHYWIKGKTTKELRAVLAYMSGRYLNYQVTGEWPDFGNVFRGTPGKYEVDLHPRLYKKLRKKDRYVKDIIKTAIRQMQIHTFWNESDAVKSVNQWICDRVDYDWKGYNDEEASVMWSAYQGLKYGRCVCEGYADIFQLFMNEIGIRAYRVSSWDHIWNVVVIDGESEYVDVCWNDVRDSYNWLLSKTFPDHDPTERIEDNRYVTFKEKRIFYSKKKGY